MREFYIEDMCCDHCVAAIEEALSLVPGITGVQCNLETQTVVVEGDADPEEIESAIEHAGYNVVTGRK